MVVGLSSGALHLLGSHSTTWATPPALLSSFSFLRYSLTFLVWASLPGSQSFYFCFLNSWNYRSEWSCPGYLFSGGFTNFLPRTAMILPISASRITGITQWTIFKLKLKDSLSVCVYFALSYSLCLPLVLFVTYTVTYMYIYIHTHTHQSILWLWEGNKDLLGVT
jgi:hypothetical protein